LTDKRPRARNHGFTLAEMLVGFGVSSIVIAAVITLGWTGAMNMTRLWNYAEMDAQSQLAADQLTRDTRRANRVSSYSSTNLVLEDFDGVALTYAYSPGARTLTRTKAADSAVLLRECDALAFSLGKRNPGGAFENFSSTTLTNEGKVLDVTWKCSRKILGQTANTENVSSAKIVIRRQKSS
jgi:type II secretory pathway pseudopilin PulG